MLSSKSPGPGDFKAARRVAARLAGRRPDSQPQA